MIANSEKFLRDLNWLTSCPSLLESPMILGTENWRWKVDELDLSPIQSFMKTSASYRVGYYVESLVGVCLQKLNGIGDIQHALQIKGSERTLGEIDFLYRLNDILHHLEISLKFYLYESEDNHSGSHFVGPNSSDYFEKKRDKMLQKQIPLGREHFPEIEVSQIMMKGMIFYPPGVDTASCLPKGLNPDHRRGVWIRASDCDWLSSSNGMEFGMILKKPYWLSGISADSEQDVLPINDLRASVVTHFQQRSHPLFISVGDASGMETMRVFVVANGWPD